MTNLPFKIRFLVQSDELSPPKSSHHFFVYTCKSLVLIVAHLGHSSLCLILFFSFKRPSSFVISFQAFHANTAHRLHFPLVKNRPSNSALKRFSTTNLPGHHISSLKQYNSVSTQHFLCFPRLFWENAWSSGWAILLTVGEKVQRCVCHRW